MNVIVVGGGKGEASTLQTLAEMISTNVVGVIVTSDDTDTIEVAKAFGIPVKLDFRALVEHDGLDVIVDLSGSDEVAAKVRRYRPPSAEVIDRAAAIVMCRLFQDESRQMHDIIDGLTREHWSLYEIGTSLSSARDLSEVYRIIVRRATALTNTPAGSLAIYDGRTGEMRYVASMGFKGEMATQERWKLRTGGLTSYILGQRGPVAIDDLDRYPELNNPELVTEGVKSLVACPLILENRVVGVIYVDDFKPRDFTEHDLSILSLLSTYAAIAIEKAELLEEAKVLAITDDLTKLYNHRYLIKQLTKELNRAKRYNEPLSFIMLDIDHFKRYNDENGHMKGNELLVELAGILQDESRDTDIIARFGGEEFTIVCPSTDKQSAHKLAERLRKRTERHAFPCACEQPCGPVTVSVGIASFPLDADGPESLIEKADTALYAAKKSGRNRVHLC